MATIETLKALIKNISALSSALPPSVPKGTTKDKIWTVMHLPEGETEFHTFNRHFNVLFGNDCYDLDGRFHYIWQGKSGMGLVCTYLKKIDWSRV